ncbi:hypothetical protein ABW20_dc0105404 [Dactylellina cionopaga]|nr:hypothetical protein ABW20_dc0105404 [Dactylellina cionopaga]
MRNLLKERLEDVTGIEKLRRSVRQDLFDDQHFLRQYPVKREPQAKPAEPSFTDMPVAPQQTIRPRPSIDLFQAAQAARRDIWRAQPNLNKMRSMDSLKTKPAVDLMTAANFVRKARGEQPLPSEPVLLESDSSHTPRYTNYNSPYQHAPQASGGYPRANAPVEEVLNFSRPSSRRSEQRAFKRRSRSLELEKPIVQLENDRPSTSNSNRSFRLPPTSYRKIFPPPVPPKDDDDSESIAELASLFPLPAKTPPGSIRSCASSIKSPPPSIRSHSRTNTGASFDSTSLHPNSSLHPSASIASIGTAIGNDIHIVEVVKSNGELHERYRTNTEDADYEMQIANPVIHERIVQRVHNITTTEITRHHYTHEIRHHVQPVIEKQLEPEKHWVQTVDGGFVEVTAEAAERLKSRYKYTTRVEEPVASLKVPVPLASPPPSYTWKPPMPKDARSRARGHTA